MRAIDGGTGRGRCYREIPDVSTQSSREGGGANVGVCFI